MVENIDSASYALSKKGYYNMNVNYLDIYFIFKAYFHLGVLSWGMIPTRPGRIRNPSNSLDPTL